MVMCLSWLIQKLCEISSRSDYHLRRNWQLLVSYQGKAVCLINCQDMTKSVEITIKPQTNKQKYIIDFLKLFINVIDCCPYAATFTFLTAKKVMWLNMDSIFFIHVHVQCCMLSCQNIKRTCLHGFAFIINYSFIHFYW